MLPFEFIIDGPPMSAQSHNRERLAAWKVEVAASAANRWTGPLFPAKVRVVVTYYHKRESAGLDADNMIKPILDALIGIVYVDDHQATHVTARSVRLNAGRVLDLGTLAALEFTRGARVLAYSDRGRSMSVISLPAQDAQVRRLYEIAREYRAKDYDVLVGPSQHELPDFLRGFEPDLVVTSDDDNAVVTVKPRHALLGSNELSRMAAAVEQQPGWRCELVLVASDADVEHPLPDSADVTRVEALLAQARDLRGSSLAIVPAVAAVENAMLIALEREALDLSSPYPSAALKTLFAYGLLSREQFDEVDAAMEMRDDVAHGRRTNIDAEPWLASIEPIVHELLTGAPD